MNSGVYSLRNTVTGDEYIGSSANLQEREKTHADAMRSSRRHPFAKVRRSVLIHGAWSFVFQVIELCEPAVMFEREQFWIDRRQPALNSRRVGIRPSPAKPSPKKQKGAE